MRLFCFEQIAGTYGNKKLISITILMIYSSIHYYKLLLLFALFLGACTETQQQVTDLTSDDDPIIGVFHYLSGFEPLTEDSLVRVVIEIPAGTNAKWEVEKDTGHLSWELRDGEPRVIHYLAYPANYGMVPRTLAGDGDSMDVLVLGTALERGKIAETRLIGVLEMLDGGDRDEKMITVMPDSHFAGIENLQQLEEQFQGILEIIELWFANYKGPGNSVEILGFDDLDRAWEILHESIQNYD